MRTTPQAKGDTGVPRSAGGRRGGFALMLVMAFMAVSFMIISGLLTWTSENAVQGQRHQEFYRTLEAPNAAVEVVVANMLHDLKLGGMQAVSTTYLNLPGLAVSQMDAAEWEEYDYPLPVTVEPWPVPVEPLLGYSPLLWKYQGMTASNRTYRIRAGARRSLVDGVQAAAIEMDVQVAEIPVFAFAALYDFDLTFVTPPWQVTTLAGRVHSNRDIFVNPSGSLTFGGDVTAGSTNRHEQHPNDAESRATGQINYQAERDSRVNSLNLVPATTQPREQILLQYYERASLILEIGEGAGGVEILTFRPPNIGVSVQATNFLRLTDPLDPLEPIEFFDRRELKTVRVIDFDIEAFSVSLGTNLIVYVEDKRPVSSEMIRGIRVINASILPPQGLTLVTPHPLYVQGNYNTVLPRPAALVADAVTVLSAAWIDSELAMGIAVDTGINAAILTGIVPSDGSAFDGGIFNALRLLEDWTGRNLTFSGSIVALYRSEQAIEPWRGDDTVYRVPNRLWTFDSNHLTPGYLPWTPVVSALIRVDWSRIAPVAPEVVFAD